MDVREWWNDQSTDVQILIALSAVIVVPVSIFVIVAFGVGIVGTVLSGGVGAPDATFDCAVDDTSITFEHVDGEAVSSDNLVVEGTDGSVDDVRFSDELIEPGDDIVVDGPTNATLRFDGSGVDEPTEIVVC